MDVCSVSDRVCRSAQTPPLNHNLKPTKVIMREIAALLATSGARNAHCVMVTPMLKLYDEFNNIPGTRVYWSAIGK